MTEFQLMACREIAYELFKILLQVADGLIQLWLIFNIYKIYTLIEAKEKEETL